MTSRLLHSAAHPSLSFFADRTWGYRNAATETTNLHPSRKQSQHLAAANSWANWQPAANTTPNLINDVTMERGFETSTSQQQAVFHGQGSAHVGSWTRWDRSFGRYSPPSRRRCSRAVHNSAGDSNRAGSMVRMKSSPGEEPRHLGVDFGKPVAGIS